MARRKNTLTVRWSKAEKYSPGMVRGIPGDVIYEWGDGCRAADASLAHHVLSCDRYRPNWQSERKPGDLPWTFDNSFLLQLHERGYDLTTLRFSIKKRGEATGPETSTD